MKLLLIFFAVISSQLGANEAMEPDPAGGSQLMDMIEKNDLHGIAKLFPSSGLTVHDLLSFDKNLTRRTDAVSGKSLLHYFCQHGIPGVETLARKGLAATFAKDNAGHIPFYYAAVNGHLQAVEELLKVSPDCIRLDAFKAIIFEVCKLGHFEVFKAIFETARKVLAKDEYELLKCKDADERTILHAACLFSRLNMVVYLLQHFPEMIHDVDKSGSTALSFAVSMIKENGKNRVYCQDQLEIVKLLCRLKRELLFIAKKSAQTAESEFRARPIELAMLNNFYPVVVLMLDEAPELASKPLADQENYLIHLACYHGFTEYVRLILEKCPDAWSFQTKSEHTILSHAMRSRNEDLVLELLHTYPQLTIGEGMDPTGSIVAGILKYDLAKVAAHYLDAEAQDFLFQEVQWQMLQAICRERACKVLKVFCKRFPKLVAKREKQFTDDEVAAFLTWSDILDILLLSYPELIDWQNDRGQTLLHLIDKKLNIGSLVAVKEKAAREQENKSGRSSIALVFILIQHGADDGKVDAEGLRYLANIPEKVRNTILAQVPKIKLLQRLLLSKVERNDYQGLEFFEGKPLTLAFSPEQLGALVQHKYQVTQDKAKLEPLLNWFILQSGTTYEKFLQECSIEGE